MKKPGKNSQEKANLKCLLCKKLSKIEWDLGKKTILDKHMLSKWFKNSFVKDSLVHWMQKGKSKMMMMSLKWKWKLVRAN
jgi:hypothetical protein